MWPYVDFWKLRYPPKSFNFLLFLWIMDQLDDVTGGRMFKARDYSFMSEDGGADMGPHHGYGKSSISGIFIVDMSNTFMIYVYMQCSNDYMSHFRNSKNMLLCRWKGFQQKPPQQRDDWDLQVWTWSFNAVSKWLISAVASRVSRARASYFSLFRVIMGYISYNPHAQCTYNYVWCTFVTTFSIKES